MQTAALSKKGLRNENQDSYFIDENRGIFIVADGMGGHNAGQIASSIAIKSASTYFIEAYHKYKRKDDLVLDALVNANKQILEHAKYNPDTSGMGTTMTFVYIDKGLAYIGHIGDSRAYLVNTNNIIQLTNDHSYVGELVRAGGLSEEDALKHPKRNLLTRALGCDEQIEIDILKRTINKDDYLLLCTDGLFNVIDDYEMQNYILKYPVNNAVDILVNSALKRDGSDNITAIIVKCF